MPRTERNHIKRGEVRATTVRTDKEDSDRFQQLYGTYTTGAEKAVRVWLYFRNIAIKEIKETITEEEFVSINELCDIEALNAKTMHDREIMLKMMKNKYEAVGGYSFSYREIEEKINQLTIERVFFLFEEVFRYRKYLQQVPNFSPREFYQEEMD